MNAQELHDLLAQQDNRITSHPMFVVQQRRERWETDDPGDASVRKVWKDRDWADITDPDRIRALEEWEDNGWGLDPHKPEEATPYYCFHDIEDVQWFLTEVAADRYVEENRHNLHEPRVYVKSGWRNREMQEIRGKHIPTLAMIERALADGAWITKLGERFKVSVNGRHSVEDSLLDALRSAGYTPSKPTGS